MLVAFHASGTRLDPIPAMPGSCGMVRNPVLLPFVYNRG